MATDLTQDSVLCFLRSRGGTVKNSELLSHFKPFLRDHDDRLRHREHFKKFVNSVATVKQEEGVSYVVLRKKFRPPDAGSPSSGDHSPKTPGEGKTSDPGAGWRTPGKTLRPHASEIPYPEEPRLTPTPTGDLAKATESNILPSAGILLNNNNNYEETNFNLVKKPLLSSTPDVPQRAARRPLLAHGPEEPVPYRTQVAASPGNAAPQHPATCPHKPADPRVEHHPASAGGVQRGVEATPRHDVEEYRRREIPSPRLHHHEGLHHNTGLQVGARGARHRKSYKSAVSPDDEEDEEVPRRADSAGGELPLSRPQDIRKTIPISLLPSLPSSLPPNLPSLPSSLPPNLPSLATSPPQSQVSGSPRLRLDFIPTIHVQDLGEPAPGWGSGEGRPRRPSDSRGLSSSHDSLFLLPSSSCSDWLSPSSPGAPSGAEWNSSNEELSSINGDVGVRVANDNRLLSLMHRSEQKTATPWHHSTGHLLDDGDQSSSLYHSTGGLAGSSEDSPSPVLLRKCPAVSRRVSTRLRSRKCLSLGAGLDLPFPGEEEVQGGGGGAAAARHNRLHLLSSSLSLRYNLSTSSLSSSSSTPPRCPSLGELAEGQEQRGGGAGRTDGPQDSSYCQRQVPLESREHVWLVKGAAGAWTDIYSLFRDEPALLQRPDFISGFTILHWIAKHGDHRVLNTLWYGVNKAGLTLEVNARSWSGYTPLHLAAMHGHKKMMRLLVNKFHANVRARDVAGKRAWQYLEAPPPLDLLYLLGGRQGAGEAPPHHHASCSSADRPQRPLTSGPTGVKRSTSIAAFLKHKSLLRFRDLADVSV